MTRARRDRPRRRPAHFSTVFETANNGPSGNAAKSFDDDQQLQTLGFRLTPEARNLSCGEVSLEGGVQVFKDLYIAAEGGV